jgi:hypothetical protein
VGGAELKVVLIDTMTSVPASPSVGGKRKSDEIERLTPFDSLDDRLLGQIFVALSSCGFTAAD